MNATGSVRSDNLLESLTTEFHINGLGFFGGFDIVYRTSNRYVFEARLVKPWGPPE